MKKSVIVLIFVLVMTALLVMTASATKPVTVNGVVPLSSVGSDDVDFWYDICDPFLVGRVVQPAEPPGKAVHGTFTAGDIPDIWEECEHSTQTELSGTCEIKLIPVENFGDPESKPGRGVMGRCTGDLKGYHATYVIDELYGYVAKYHIDP
jgi:hypothetical protein